MVLGLSGKRKLADSTIKPRKSTAKGDTAQLVSSSINSILYYSILGYTRSARSSHTYFSPSLRLPPIDSAVQQCLASSLSFYPRTTNGQSFVLRLSAADPGDSV